MSNGYALSSDLFELAEQNDRRFKRLLKIFGIPALILAIVSGAILQIRLS